MKYLITALFLFPLATYADKIATPSKLFSYSCQLIIAADDVPAKQGMWQFDVLPNGASHGSNGSTYTVGLHQIYVAADGQWLSLGWTKGGVLVAKGLFVIGSKDTAQERVAILYSTDGSDDQVSIGCSKK
jgi:hypothetical protein